jgi:hypothetical protein
VESYVFPVSIHALSYYAFQTAIKESLRSIGIDAGLAFFGILVSITLMVNGIIAIIGGTILVFLDRRRSKHNSVSK